MSYNADYPYTFAFRIGTIHNDFSIRDAQGYTRAYVKQKMFKLKEHVDVFTDEGQGTLYCQIKSDKWLDFNTVYSFIFPDGSSRGKLARKGWASIWKASYELYDEHNQKDLVIKESNPWAKVGDAVLCEIPLLGMLSGYLFNPAYQVSRPDGTVVAVFKKLPSFFGRNFELSQSAPFEHGEEDRIKLGLMMMALLERRRG